MGFSFKCTDYEYWFFLVGFNMVAWSACHLLQIEKQEFGLKPMNCPGHCLIFDHRVRSYRGELMLTSSFTCFFFYIVAEHQRDYFSALTLFSTNFME